MAKQRVTRALVVEAAARHVNTYGFAALTLAPIAAELGIKIPSLYNHVDGLDALQAALAGFGAQALFLRCQDASSSSIRASTPLPSTPKANQTPN